ncbi:DUF3043 domain-containing protein [Streptomyces sp. B1866]|uniref:DUF3043 domain-containing protein n=1 Tax=Streptomyces sp. B1866 TaxID=3075431 RepID=UPI00288FE365|nr:DUF3043 domain-containing protein [Streptomyces sp. B1866]MDT3398811.1 DUF3043 domain-containing protein [Streptomyces sp. B1866]
MGSVFRSRSRDEQAATVARPADQPSQPRDPQAPKGRPTPKRSEARNPRRTVANTPADRKDAAKRRRETRRTALTRQREALATGDERYLPPRDKGPVRRFARDYVDSRFVVAEFFLPLAVVILVLSLFRAGPLQSYVLLLWMAVIFLIVVNSAVIAVRLKRELRRRFPDENLRGAVPYALMRTLQMRRLRLPKPQVGRGERP